MRRWGGLFIILGGIRGESFERVKDVGWVCGGLLFELFELVSVAYTLYIQDFKPKSSKITLYIHPPYQVDNLLQTIAVLHLHSRVHLLLLDDTSLPRLDDSAHITDRDVGDGQLHDSNNKR